LGFFRANKNLLAFAAFSGYVIVYDIYNIAMITLTLQQERARILEEMGQIDQMVRGHLSQQTYRVQRHGRTITQGPYYLLQRRENGKNNCHRVGADELQAIVAGVEAHQRFTTLAERYAALTEQMTWAQQPPAIKKKFRRFWQSTSPKRRPS
jgi:hypothetical protein